MGPRGQPTRAQPGTPGSRGPRRSCCLRGRSVGRGAPCPERGGTARGGRRRLAMTTAATTVIGARAESAPDGVGAAEAASCLGTHRGEVLPGRSEQARARRDERLRQRRWLWRHSVRERTRDCGRRESPHGWWPGGADVRRCGGPSDGGAGRMGVAGLVTCGSQTCPCCAPGAPPATRSRAFFEVFLADHLKTYHPAGLR